MHALAVLALLLAQTGAGKVAGKVTLSGLAPKLAPLPVTRDMKTCGTTKPDESLEVGQGGGVQLGFVGVEPVLLRAGGVRVERTGLAERLQLGAYPGDEECRIDGRRHFGVSCRSAVAVPSLGTSTCCSFSPRRSCQSFSVCFPGLTPEMV